VKPDVLADHYHTKRKVFVEMLLKVPSCLRWSSRSDLVSSAESRGGHVYHCQHQRRRDGDCNSHTRFLPASCEFSGVAGVLHQVPLLRLR
jgi:hypothetical protein